MYRGCFCWQLTDPVDYFDDFGILSAGGQEIKNVTQCVYTHKIS